MPAQPGTNGVTQQSSPADPSLTGLGGQGIDSEAAVQSGIPRTVWTASTQRSSILYQEWLTHHAELWDAMLKAPATSVAVLGHKPGDRRFSDPSWSESPIYDYWRRIYLLNSHYLKKMAAEVPLAPGRVRARFDFLLRQYIDAMSPANFAATNPEFVRNAVASNGESIQRAVRNLIHDVERGAITTTDETAFRVGDNLATTLGKVVFENELFQLLQYQPLTQRVAERPLLMVPPCINKYYILDLQPHNSFVRHGVEQGNTVFMMSWRNPAAAQGGLTWDDYIEQGILKAIEVVREITGVEAINTLGFCVGGTMLGVALAVARARGETPAHSLTLLTTLLDFSDSGDLACFIDEAMVAAKEAAIGKAGIFPGREMAAAFSSLRANDMIWQYVVGNYLKGDSPPAFDLLYWNADSTNLPGPFLVWYLKNMYLDNSLCTPGRLPVCGVNVDLGAVDLPTYVFAAREDHIVPWRSAYRTTALLPGSVTFTLGASGHIAGVINPARANKRSYWSGPSDGAGADDWLAAAQETQGSWWPHWSRWLDDHAGNKIPARKKTGNRRYKPGAAAPGSYVLEKAQ